MLTSCYVLGTHVAVKMTLVSLGESTHFGVQGGAS